MESVSVPSWGRGERQRGDVVCMGEGTHHVEEDGVGEEDGFETARFGDHDDNAWVDVVVGVTEVVV